MEEWRVIPSIGMPYMVSNYGNVKRAKREIVYENGSVRHDPERNLSPTFNSRVGRWYVMISPNGTKRRNYLLHRLVAEAFCANDDPATKVTVNHIDGNPSNNRADNLEWVSYSDNLLHAYDVLSRRHNRSQQFKRPCIVYNSVNNKGCVYESIASAARSIGLSETQIRRIISGDCRNNTYQIQYA